MHARACRACGLPIEQDTWPRPVNTLAHIAILDDDVDITQLLCNCLESRGLRAAQVPSGRDLMALSWTLDAAGRCLVDPAGAELALTTGEFDLLVRSVRGAGYILVPAVTAA